MKNIIKLAVIAFSLAILSSCNLEEYSQDKYSRSVAFGSVDGVEMALRGLYGGLPKVTSTYSSEVGATDYFMAELDDKFTVTYGPDNVESWGDWEDLRDINYFIEAVESESCTISASLKPNYIGLAKFFRAKRYFTYLCEYGDVPWYDSVIQPDQLDLMFKDRDSRDLIVKNIIADLDDAAANITNVSPDKSTPDKWCALMLKSRVCLFEGTYRKYHNLNTSLKGEAFTNYTADDLLALAAEAAKQIMDGGKFSLNTAAGVKGAYRDLFYSEALLQNEVLMGAVTSPGTIQGSQNNCYNQPAVQRSFIRPFINTYLCKDGSLFTDKAGYETMSFVQEFKDRDPRLAQTVRGPQYKMIKTVGGTEEEIAVPDIKSLAAPLGYQVIKFTMDKTFVDGESQSKLNTNSTPYFRYAEALLNYAEAKAELGELSDSDWSKTIGALRRRAGITGGDLDKKPTKVDSYLKNTFFPDVNDAVILEIRRERGCELCLEGQRVLDWKRWAIGKNFSDLKWTGIHITDLDTPIDINEDGINDYYFATADPKNEYSDIWVSIKTSGEGLYATPNSKGGYDLEYKYSSNKRYWADKLYTTPMAVSEINKYSQNGFTLTQSTGY